MRIGILSYEYPPETGFGGIGTYSWYQARALVKLGHEVHVLAGAKAPTARRRCDHDGVRVHRYRWGGPARAALRPLARPRLFWTRNRIENALSMHLALGQIRREVDLDVLEMPECGAEGLLVNHLTSLPTIVKFHSPAQLIMGWYDVSAADRFLCGALERRAFLRAGGFTAGSRFLADEVRHRLGLRRSVPVVPNGIDLELFDASDRVDVRAKFGLPRDRPLIFFAGRIERRKGAHLLADIAASVLARHDAAFVVAGQDVFRYAEEVLLPRLDALGLRDSLYYLGKLDAPDVRSCLRESDVFLIPSLWENCPYACLEAMAAGRAIVSSDAGGLPELIRDGENGLVAPCGDVQGHVAGIERLLQDPALRERLGDAARRSVRASYTDVAIAEASLEQYRRVLEV